ncbi:hypothetical protein [Roseibium sp. RKSG952]|uniref:hypothetical protein n=1 Tax=Roseibium sp. RKSG952 TaxID=2529384 RepID=UPI0012BBA627|nr:hypothetical protein [Roseibium sp. RKSG952]
MCKATITPEAILEFPAFHPAIYEVGLPFVQCFDLGHLNKKTAKLLTLPVFMYLGPAEINDISGDIVPETRLVRRHFHAAPLS